jgi:hypothetical protein
VVERHTQRMKRSAVAAVLLVIGLLPATAAQAAGQRTYVIGDCLHAQYKPTTIVLACGDGYLQMTRIKYSSWGSREAEGTDRTFQQDCTPDCADGHPTYHHDHFVLDRPEKRHGVWIFSRARLYRGDRLYLTQPIG